MSQSTTVVPRQIFPQPAGGGDLPDNGAGCAVSVGDEGPQAVTIVPVDFSAANGNRDWAEAVGNNCRLIRPTYTLATAGYYTLKIWSACPAVILERIVTQTGGVKPGSLGPPERGRN